MYTLSLIRIHTLDGDPVLVVKHFITSAAVKVTLPSIHPLTTSGTLPEHTVDPGE